MMEAGKIQAEEYQKAVQMYTMDDLMAKAQEMYKFVSTKE
jgi:hypothetical protein